MSILKHVDQLENACNIFKHVNQLKDNNYKQVISPKVTLNINTEKKTSFLDK